MQEQPKIRKYVCPNCGKEMSGIRISNNSVCSGITIKCKKCGKIIEIIVKPIDF